MAGKFETRELSGALFKNDRKEQPNHPDYRGDCKIDGAEYWVSGWIKEGARGKWLSVAFTPKVPKNDDFETMADRPKPNPKPKPNPIFDDLEDDVPF